jgi:catechol 2,3-dioxygenase-like lactoylglutathione lyase family enzyme
MSPESPSQLKNARLRDIGIVARDMNKTVRRLEALGIGPFLPPKPDPKAEGMYFHGKPLKGDFQTIIAHAGNAEIEVFEVHSNPNPWEKLIAAKGEGIHHLGFHIDDVEQEVKRLTSLGAEVVLTAMGRGKMEAAYVDLNVAGIVIEIMSYPRPAQPPPDDKTFTKPWDVAVLTKDIAKAAQRLEALGIERFTQGGPPKGAEGLFYLGKPFISQSKAQIYRIGNVHLELIEPDDKPNPWTAFLNANGEGFHHVGFHVEDVEAAIKRLTALGAPVPFYGRISGKTGAAYVDAKTANLFFELTNFRG